MKTILRIVIILAAALLVVGVTYALGGGNATDQRFAPRFEEFRGENGAASANPGDTNGTTNQEQFRPNRNSERGGFEGRGFGGRGEFEGGRRGGAFGLGSLLGFSQTLVPITIMIALIAGVGQVSRWRKRSQKANSSQVA